MENFHHTFSKLNINSLLRNIIPVMDLARSKGENGIIGIIGGSLEYTGAPYYAAISALKMGSDLSHIFCHRDAAIPIKTYSPEFIVHPAFDDSGVGNKTLIDKTVKWFKSMDAIGLGCGLGREDYTTEIFNHFLGESLKLDSIPHIIDADGLWHFMNADLSKFPLEDSLVVLTPNKNEFDRLCNKFLGEDQLKENKEEKTEPKEEEKSSDKEATNQNKKQDKTQEDTQEKTQEKTLENTQEKDNKDKTYDNTQNKKTQEKDNKSDNNNFLLKLTGSSKEIIDEI
jgi:hydroxyethylthiazole kinase-like uncharacterized protein yjeF